MGEYIAELCSVDAIHTRRSTENATVAEKPRVVIPNGPFQGGSFAVVLCCLILASEFR